MKISVNQREINQRKSARKKIRKLFHADVHRLKAQMGAEKNQR
jgi:hypothetical protein